MAEVLIADDEKGYREVLRVIFEDQGHTVSTANDGRAALALLKKRPCDVVISDVRMPAMDGIEFLRAARSFYPEIGIVMMTAFGTINTAREAFKLGADDFIQKPFNNDELRLIVQRAIERKALIDENRALRSAQRRVGSAANIVGSSDAIRNLLHQIETVAREEATILVIGESGSGKELVARAIHDRSDRAERPFLPINCGAMTETLLESELFGFVKGAFTGAVQARPGMFESSHTGSIFLDEIGDMSQSMQVKVLRVLQERKVRRIGAAAETTVDTRVIAATNRDLGPMVSEGKFREDLFYRLSVIPIYVPALRERREDIPELAMHFINKFSKRSGKTVNITDEAMENLRQRPWPGNVRELENTIERAVAFTPTGESIAAGHCTGITTSNGHKPQLPVEGLHLPSCLNKLEREYVQEALSRTNGNQTRAADLLQIPVHALRHLLDKHQLRQT
ncbi:MAG TPA: sigma-54 dependent transcriptional regulator [Pyrinomonadaceae bacterium]|nr:sigma-54 dependent transcriptional regulator [Pyrinomonadaceae bacterium]